MQTISKGWWLGLGILLLLAAAAGAVTRSATMPAPSEELRELRAAQEATRNEVAALRQLIERALAGQPPAAGSAMAGAAAPGGGAPESYPLKLQGRPQRGSRAASVVLIEYSDYECPYCAQYTRDVYPRIDAEFVRTGKIRYLVKSYPIAQLHPNAFPAHVAAACAGDQGKYWEMHEWLLAHQSTSGGDALVGAGRTLGLDERRYASCRTSGAHDVRIREDIDEAVRGGVRGTPVFALAIAAADAATATAVQVLVGAQPYERFRESIEKTLAQAR